MRFAAPTGSREGVLVPGVAPGAPVVTGQVLAQVVGLDGAEREILHAERAGLVLSWTESVWVKAKRSLGQLQKYCAESNLVSV